MPETPASVPLTQNPDGTWTSPDPQWAHLINRESSGRPTVTQQITDVNSGGNEAEGLFQITPKTWREHGGDQYATRPSLATPQQQSIIAARILQRNPTGSDWGAGIPGRENAQGLMSGLAHPYDFGRAAGKPPNMQRGGPVDSRMDPSGYGTGWHMEVQHADGSTEQLPLRVTGQRVGETHFETAYELKPGDRPYYVVH